MRYLCATMTLAALVAVASAGAAEVGDCRAKAIEYHGWQAIEQSNDLITLVTVPDIGGRTIQMRLGDYGFFWENHQERGRLYPVEEHRTRWVNYGGFKNWLMPEDKFQAATAAEIDAGHYRASIISAGPPAATIELVSPDDRRRGIRVTRRLTIYPDSTRVHVEQVIENIIGTPVTWGIWDVTQMDCSARAPADGDYNSHALVYFRANPKSRFDRGFNVLFGPEDNPQWQPNAYPGIFAAQYRRLQAKMAADSAAGWIAWVDSARGKVYAKAFRVYPRANYPDGGATVEVYTDQALPYLEVEVLAPLVELKPGESYQFDEDWYAATCSGPIVDVCEAGAISQPLAVRGIGEGGRIITGQFGVFHRGSAKLVFYNAVGQRQPTTIDLGPVSPNSSLTVSETVTGHPDIANSTRVELYLVSPANKRIAMLASAELR